MSLDRDTDSFCKAVADELERLREEKGLSQNRLSQMAGLSQSTIGLLERCSRTPTVGTLYRLAQNLGVTPSDILRGAEKSSGFRNSSAKKE